MSLIYQSIYRTEECLEVQIVNNEKNQQTMKNIVQFYFKKLKKKKTNPKIVEEENLGIYRFPKFSDEIVVSRDNNNIVEVKCEHPIKQLDEIRFFYPAGLKSFQLKNATRLVTSLKKHLGIVYHSSSFLKNDIHEFIDTILWTISRLKKKTVIVFNDDDKYYQLWKLMIVNRFSKKCLDFSWIILKKQSNLLCNSNNKFFRGQIGLTVYVNNFAIPISTKYSIHIHPSNLIVSKMILFKYGKLLHEKLNEGESNGAVNGSILSILPTNNNNQKKKKELGLKTVVVSILFHWPEYSRPIYYSHSQQPIVAFWDESPKTQKDDLGGVDVAKTVNLMTKNSTRNDLIMRCLKVYFIKKEQGHGEGFLLVSENDQHLIELQKNFSDSICTFIMENRLKQKEILYELKQKRELVFATYVDLTNPLFSNELGYVSVIFFLTPRTPDNGISIIKKIINRKSPSEKKHRLVVMDLVDSFSHTKHQFETRKAKYQEFMDVRITTQKL
jgi:hypothetical protein